MYVSVSEWDLEGERKRENRKSTPKYQQCLLWGDRREGLEWFLLLSLSFSVFFKISTQKSSHGITCMYKKQTGSSPLHTRSSLISFVWHTILIYLAHLLFPALPLSSDQAYTHNLLVTLFCVPRWPFLSPEFLLPGTEQSSPPSMN